jgi:hypothetical protein
VVNKSPIFRQNPKFQEVLGSNFVNSLDPSTLIKIIHDHLLSNLLNFTEVIIHSCHYTLYNLFRCTRHPMGVYWARRIESTSSLPIALRFILILSSNFHLYLQVLRPCTTFCIPFIMMVSATCLTPIWSINPFRLFATGYSKYSQQPSTSGSSLVFPDPEDSPCHDKCTAQQIMSSIY